VLAVVPDRTRQVDRPAQVGHRPDRADWHSTRGARSLTAAYGAVEGTRLWQRFEIHFTPKHASWLNMAEMEASLVARECLGQRRIQALCLLQGDACGGTAGRTASGAASGGSFVVRDARRVFRYDGITTKRSEHSQHAWHRTIAFLRRELTGS
jgi:hypothetical protein